MSNTATAKQIEFINRLASERDATRVEPILSMGRELWRAHAFDTEAASAIIDALMEIPRPEVERVEVLEGMHRLNGQIYKVQRAVNGSGRLYAKALVQDEIDSAQGWSFVYSPGAVRHLSEATVMTLDEAKEFGALYGTCCVCGRTLTDENSIAAGIGPVCAGKF